jgi:acyl carrier protein
MTVSSRTPEGMPHHRPVCGKVALLDLSETGDTVCPSCGHLLWWFRDSFAVRLGIDLSKVRLETPLGDLGADSLDIVEYVMEVEEQFGIVIPDEDAVQLRTLADLIRYITRKRGGPAA